MNPGTLTSGTLTPGDLHARIAQLFIYPVKSCAGLALQESLLTDTGLEFDRAWMVVDAQGNFVTQREAPQLALVTPQFKGDQLVLRAPGMLALYLNLYEYEGNTQVTVWDDSLPAFDMGDLAAQWFTDFLAQFESKVSTPAAYRLARFDPEQQRLSSLQWTAGVQAPNLFSDGYPLLVVSQASLDGLNARLLASGHAAVGMARFRPNIVLTGLQAHDEDRLSLLRVQAGLNEDANGVQLKPVKPCARCPIPNIDPATAQSSPAVGDTLQAYRQDDRVNGGITFGMNAITLSGQGAVLRVGQAVMADLDFG